MYGHLSSGLLNMYCEVYAQETRQDKTSGAITKKWVFVKKIQCHVDIISHSGASISDNNKTFGDVYIEEAKILLKTHDKLSKRYRISGIRNRSQDLLFTEVDKIDNPPTIFEIESHHPRLDPLGNVLYYESNLRRTSIQSYDTN